MQIRVSPEAEIEGLDVPEFGALCYPDFVIATTRTGRHTPRLDGPGDVTPARPPRPGAVRYGPAGRSGIDGRPQ